MSQSVQAGVAARRDQSGLAQILLISAAGTVILMIGFGVRHGFGLFFQPIAERRPGLALARQTA